MIIVKIPRAVTLSTWQDESMKRGERHVVNQ